MLAGYVLSSFNQKEWVAMFHKVNNQDCSSLHYNEKIKQNVSEVI